MSDVTLCISGNQDADLYNTDLYDFYMHGDVDAIEKANGVRKSDVWFLLNGQ